MGDSVESIEQQLAYLSWRKTRNERAIRDIIIAKSSKSSNKIIPTMTTRKSILEEEASKSLVLTPEQISALTNIRLRSPDRNPWSPSNTNRNKQKTDLIEIQKGRG
jgi:hypothetical protein